VSTIDAFIDQDGLDEFRSDRMSLVIDDELRQSIVATAHVSHNPNAILQMPLDQLLLNTGSIQDGGCARHMAVEMSAMLVIRRLKDVRQ
jgi:hypothetical protein